MEDIVINGVSVNALVEQRKAIREGAAKVLSDSIERLTELVNQILEAEEYPAELVKEAENLTEVINVVLGASGVRFLFRFTKSTDTMTPMKFYPAGLMNGMVKVKSGICGHCIVLLKALNVIRGTGIQADAK